MKKVAIIMGSDSDFPIVSKAIKQLKDYDVPFEVHVMSAHRTPDEATSFAKNAKELASKNNVLLWDGNKLNELIDNYNKDNE